MIKYSVQFSPFGVSKLFLVCNNLFYRQHGNKLINVTSSDPLTWVSYIKQENIETVEKWKEVIPKHVSQDWVMMEIENALKISISDELDIALRNFLRAINCTDVCINEYQIQVPECKECEKKVFGKALECKPCGQYFCLDCQADFDDNVSYLLYSNQMQWICSYCHESNMDDKRFVNGFICDIHKDKKYKTINNLEKHLVHTEGHQKSNIWRIIGKQYTYIPQPKNSNSKKRKGSSVATRPTKRRRLNQK